MPSIIQTEINITQTGRNQNQHDQILLKNELTLKEIVFISGLSINSLKRRMKVLGIKPCRKMQLHPHGKACLYKNEDVRKILSVPRQHRNPKIFYRVSVQNGFTWYVKHAGLEFCKAKELAAIYKSNGINSRITGSNGKRIYIWA